jgi:hypothetical protein
MWLLLLQPQGAHAAAACPQIPTMTTETAYDDRAYDQKMQE